MDDLDIPDIETKLNIIKSVILEKAVRMAPRDKGFMASTIKCEWILKDDNVIFILKTPVKYAEDFEYGRPPGLLSENEKVAVRDWSHRHGIKNAEGVIIGLQKRGIKPGTVTNPKHITTLQRDSYWPFFRPALHQSIPMIKEVLTK